MPIKGLTDQTITIGAGLPVIARLYKGEEKPENANRPGKDLDYFRVEFEPQFEHLRPDWIDLYGERPREFPRAYFAAPTVDEAFQAWKEEWTATVLLHRCDGESQVQWWDTNAGVYFRSKKPCAAPACACKPTGRLNLILPDLLEATGILGYVALTTHSVNDILTLYRYLSDIQRMYGQITGVPFVFGRAKRVISVPKGKSANGGRSERMRASKSLLYVHVAGDFALERLLPAMAAQVTPTVPEPRPILNAEDARRLLGAGDQRRIGGGKVVVGNSKPATADDAADAADADDSLDPNAWLCNATRRKAFFDWATKWGLNEGGVWMALENAVDYVVTTPEDWHEGERAAAAAVVAAACDYDVAEIDKRTSSANLSIKVRDAAIMLAERVKTMMAEFGGNEDTNGSADS